MVVETGPFQTDIPRQLSVTGFELIKLIHQVNRILYRSRGGIGAEIFGLILLHFTGDENTRIFLSHCHLNIRIRLVVLKHGIVFRTVFLNQVILQNQRFQL